MPDPKEEIEAVKATDVAPDIAKVDKLASLSLSSRAVHADDHLNNVTDVAPPLHLSTTFRYDDNPENLLPWADREVRIYIFLKSDCVTHAVRDIQEVHVLM